MTKPALNPVGLNRAQARNAELRALEPKTAPEPPASGAEQTVFIITSQHLRRWVPYRFQQKTQSEPDSPIQIP